MNLSYNKQGLMWRYLIWLSGVVLDAIVFGGKLSSEHESQAKRFYQDFQRLDEEERNLPFPERD